MKNKVKLTVLILLSFMGNTIAQTTDYNNITNSTTKLIINGCYLDLNER